MFLASAHYLPVPLMQRHTDDPPGLLTTKQKQVLKWEKHCPSVILMILFNRFNTSSGSYLSNSSKEQHDYSHPSNLQIFFPQL